MSKYGHLMNRVILPFTIVFLSFLATGQTMSNAYTLKPATAEHPGFFEYLPDAYDNSKNSSYPLILFLHGMGERDMGEEEDLSRLLKWGPPRIVAKNGSEMTKLHPYRFIILAPQVKAPDARWTETAVHEFLNYALENYRIDTQRIYLTGISMGGNGTWNYAYSELNKPNRIAAIAPIAGWGNPAKACEIIEKKIPVWAFHGMNDPVVSYQYGKSVFTALSKCNQSLSLDDYRFSPLNAEHVSWPPVYSSVSDSLSIYDWFMKYTLDREIIPSDTNKQSSASSWVAPVYRDMELTLIGSLSEEIYESSGLVVSDNGGFLSHNDSGNEPILYELDKNGNLLNQKRISYSQNIDWEDLARDKKGNIYIGDIGNNMNVRNQLAIYKVKSDQLGQDQVNADKIAFVYEDQKDFPPSSSRMYYDAESLIHHNDSLYIFTKNRTEPFTGYTHIYSLPDQPGNYTATLVDSIKLGEGIMTNYWLTAADISPSGDKIALLSHDKLWILSCFSGKKFSEGEITELRLNSYTQKEAIVFSDENTLYLSDERIRNVLGGNFYRLILPSDLSKSCE